MSKTPLEEEIHRLRKTLTEEEVITEIKKSKLHIFHERKHYPFGVYVFENSKNGGVLVGNANHHDEYGEETI